MYFELFSYISPVKHDSLQMIKYLVRLIKVNYVENVFRKTKYEIKFLIEFVQDFIDQGSSVLWVSTTIKFKIEMIIINPLIKTVIF